MAIQKILSCVARMAGRFDGRHVVRVLRGDATALGDAQALTALSTFGIMPDWSDRAIGAAMKALHGAHCLNHDGTTKLPLAITTHGLRVVRRLAGFQISWPASATARAARGARQAPPSDPAEAARLQALKAWRSQKAKLLSKAVYQVLHNRALEALAAAPPDDLAAVEAVPGMGPVTTRRYGAELLALLKEHR